MKNLEQLEFAFDKEAEFHRDRVNLLNQSIDKCMKLKHEMIDIINDRSLTRKEVDKRCLPISEKIYFLSTIPMINEN